MIKASARLATAEDTPKFVEFMTTTPQNLFDPGIAGYKNLRTVAIEEDGKPVLFAPFHPVLAVESLAHKPDMTPKENAIALRKLQDTLDEIAQMYGMREIYWQCKDETLIKLAERHGYEVLKYSVLRKRVPEAAQQALQEPKESDVQTIQ